MSLATTKRSILAGTLMLMTFLWVSNASAGMICSTMESDQIQLVVSCSVPMDQPSEDSEEQICEEAGNTLCMTGSAVSIGHELPIAICMVGWLAPASETGERLSLDRCFDLPASIPIELLKIPISATAT